ncbi:hypothetical protein ACWGS9_30265 [Bradyrhizobium sp. Arg314]
MTVLLQQAEYDAVYDPDADQLAYNRETYAGLNKYRIRNVAVIIPWSSSIACQPAGERDVLLGSDIACRARGTAFQF